MLRVIRGHHIWLELFILTVITLSLSTLLASNGIGWLSAQAIPDGGYQSLDGIATPYQSTAEVICALYAFGGIAQPSIPTSLQYFADDAYQSIEYLVRIIDRTDLVGCSVAGHIGICSYVDTGCYQA